MEQSAVVEETVITGEWAFDISTIKSELVPVNGETLSALAPKS